MVEKLFAAGCTVSAADRRYFSVFRYYWYLRKKLTLWGRVRARKGSDRNRWLNAFTQAFGAFPLVSVRMLHKMQIYWVRKIKADQCCFNIEKYKCYDRNPRFLKSIIEWNEWKCFHYLYWMRLGEFTSSLSPLSMSGFIWTQCKDIGITQIENKHK